MVQDSRDPLRGFCFVPPVVGVFSFNKDKELNNIFFTSSLFDPSINFSIILSILDGTSNKDISLGFNWISLNVIPANLLGMGS